MVAVGLEQRNIQCLQDLLASTGIGISENGEPRRRFLREAGGIFQGILKLK